MVQRRDFIKSAGASLVILPALSFFPAYGVLNGATRQKKVIWVFLRGAMDGLSAVVPVGDPSYKKFRAQYQRKDSAPLLPISDFFAFDSKLSFLHNLYQQKELSIGVAVASAYRKRSHFDAQDQMESGLDKTEHDNGWLARALAIVGGMPLAISRTTPIALKGDIQAQTWYPSTLDSVDDDLLARLSDMYEHDVLLKDTLNTAIMQSNNEMMMGKRQGASFVNLASECGRLLSGNADNNETVINCGMLEMGGWDTHNNQRGRLSRQFTQLNDGLKALKSSLGKNWEDTLVFVTTEFGRTVAINGTNGTDHGTASTMFMLGGALKKESPYMSGGNIYGEWPGLSNLYQDRDLNATSDLRYWIAKGLQAHWDLNIRQINRVFPDITL
ncbi:DUF1501 domain-containing protein [Agaribacter marinus]|uniref:DUF1501 domain-containing protein n=1 Tax=Agaribacter marinus TaxID=1431249 RepID=A0AA37SXX5_9ALTE|nr:DUF1501 domain-containing protein [Agaribacter marinus]GLR70544.1 hypothetical protein GCM10007852_14520 [Agaribacter marinus]